MLVLSNENQTKGDKTPFEHFGDNKQKWDKFEAYITTKENYLKLGKAKVGKLLDKNFANREKEFLNRHLNDTRIISKTVKNYIEKHLSFQENDTIQRRVYVVSGKLTSTLRHQWGLENKNRNNHYHHFEDAVLIAFSNNATIQKLSTYYKSLETYKKEGKNKPKFTKPYDKFTHDIKSMIEKMTVVREPKVSNKGEIHKETIKKGDKGKGLLVRGGIASNGEIVRTDVFKDLKKEIYYLVPLYLKDLNKTLPEKFITANKKEEEWQVLDLTKQKFVFSLYPSDLVEVKTKKVSAFGYFISPDSSTANLTLLSPDNISNDSFKKSIAYFTLTIETVQTMPKDEWKKHFEELSKLKSIKKETKLFTKTLTLKLKILNIEKTINDILHELNHHYTIVRLENHLNNIEIDKNPSSENKLQIAIVLEKRALRGIGVKQSIISFKKFSIDLLGDITEAPMEKTRKPFTKS